MALGALVQNRHIYLLASLIPVCNMRFACNMGWISFTLKADVLFVLVSQYLVTVHHCVSVTDFMSLEYTIKTAKLLKVDHSVVSTLLSDVSPHITYGKMITV